MIVPMKKVFLVTLSSKKESALKGLKKAGVVHLEEYKGESEQLDELNHQRHLLERAISFLPLKTNVKKTRENKEDKDSSPQNALEISKRIIYQSEQKRLLYEEIEKLNREKDRLLPWGYFDPNDINELHKKNVDLRLFDLTKHDILKFPESLKTFPIKKTKQQVLIAAVVEKDDDISSFKEFPIPDKGLSQIEKEIHTKEEEINRIEKELATLKKYRSTLQAALDVFNDQASFEEIKTGMSIEGPLSYISGFVPEDYSDTLKKKAVEADWALLLTEPTPEDQIPTLVKNPKPVRIIKPVFDLMGTVPGYREIDISLSFLIFLSIFFAMILSDAGYGLIVFGGALYGMIKCKKAEKPIPEGLLLIGLMSFCTIIWGTITGTWFGSKTLANFPLFSALTIPAIASFGEENTYQVLQYICFVIGTVHLSIARIWKFVADLKKKPKIRAFAQLGWLSMILGLFYLVLFLVLDQEKYPLPNFSLYMIFIGLGAVFIFSQQEGHFLKGVLKGISGVLPTFLDSISAFSDIISYIRLFAVGLATVEIAKSFNEMAAGLGNDFVGIIGGIFILLLGHTLNLAMGALSVIVHGVRLNMLEFSSHLGMEWTGVAYNPFRYKKAQ